MQFLNITCKAALCGLLLFTTTLAQGQDPKVNTPYSYFGVGNLLDGNTLYPSSMGGLGAAFQHATFLNMENPASYSRLTMTSFEGAVYGMSGRIKSDNESFRYGDGNLSYLHLGFPFKNPINKLGELNQNPVEIGMAFGIRGLSQVGYDIETTGSPIGIPDDTIQYNYEGSGGLTMVNFGGSAKYNNFSAGVKVEYLFGKIVDQRNTQFLDLDASFGASITESINYRGFLFTLGLQHELIFQEEKAEGVAHVLKNRNKMRLSTGLTFRPSSSVNQRLSQQVLRISNSLGRLDTLAFNQLEDAGSTTYPSKIAFGAILSKGQQWSLGFNFESEQWSSFDNGIRPGELQNTYRIGIGGQFSPDPFRRSLDYVNWISYRGGFHFGKDSRVINNDGLNDFGISFGLGLPIRLQKGLPSSINLGFEYAEESASSLLKDTRLRFNIGFTLNDNRWFYKRKYD